MSILSDLEAIVGRRRVSTSVPVCLSYAYNAILGKGVVRKPDIVVMPETTEEVSAVIKAANRHKVPVTPKGMVGAKIVSTCYPEFAADVTGERLDESGRAARSIVTACTTCVSRMAGFARKKKLDVQICDLSVFAARAMRIADRNEWRHTGDW